MTSAKLTKIVEKLNQIDAKIDELQEVLENGLDALFDAIEHLLKMENVKERLRDIHHQQYTLLEAFHDFINPKISDELRQSYAGRLHKLCTSGSFAPSVLSRKSYYLGCSECALYGEPGGFDEDVAGLVKDAALELYPNDQDARILWYNAVFLVPTVYGLFLDTFLHGVCIYHDRPVCPQDDNNWVRKHHTIADGSKEVVANVFHQQSELLDSQMPTISPSSSPSQAPVEPCRVVEHVVLCPNPTG